MQEQPRLNIDFQKHNSHQLVMMVDNYLDKR
jgi:hypothetical protein